MPNENPLHPASANAEEHNKEIAGKLADQDIAGKSMAGSEFGDASNALDALMKDAEKKASDAPVVEPEPKEKAANEPKEKAGNEPKEKAGNEPKEKGTAPDIAEPKEKPTPPAAQTPPKDEAAEKRAAELFKDTPSLPPNASPKSSEAFSAVKIRAAQEVSRLEKQIQDLTKTTSELSEKLKNPVPEEVNRELAELRQFRAKLDVEIDPKFKEYDKSISSAQEFIYAQLKKSPAITDETIAQIKKYGGPENINLEKIFEAIKDPTIQRLVEAKVADIEQNKFNKEQAIKSTKENISQYLADREKAFKDVSTSHNTATKTELEKLTASLDWFKPKQVPAGADDAAKQSIEDHNKFLSETQKQLNDALSDDSPEMRAIMLVGMAQLFNLQRVHASTKAEIDGLKKQLSESQALVERLKAPSKSRLNESSAPTGRTEQPKPKDQFGVSAGDALDNIRNQVIEERAKAAAAGA